MKKFILLGVAIVAIVAIIVAAYLIFRGRGDGSNRNSTAKETEINSLQLVPNILTGCVNATGFKDGVWNNAELSVGTFQDNSKYTVGIGTIVPHDTLGRIEIKNRAPTPQTTVSSQIWIINKNGELTTMFDILKEGRRRGYTSPVKVYDSEGNARIQIKVNNKTNTTKIYLNNEEIFHFDEAFGYYASYPMIVDLFPETNFYRLQVCPH